MACTVEKLTLLFSLYPPGEPDLALAQETLKAGLKTIPARLATYFEELNTLLASGQGPYEIIFARTHQHLAEKNAAQLERDVYAWNRLGEECREVANKVRNALGMPTQTLVDTYVEQEIERLHKMQSQARSGFYLSDDEVEKRLCDERDRTAMELEERFSRALKRAEVETSDQTCPSSRQVDGAFSQGELIRSPILSPREQTVSDLFETVFKKTCTHLKDRDVDRLGKDLQAWDKLSDKLRASAERVRRALGLPTRDLIDVYLDVVIRRIRKQQVLQGSASVEAQRQETLQELQAHFSSCLEKFKHNTNPVESK